MPFNPMFGWIPENNGTVPAPPKAEQKKQYSEGWLTVPGIEDGKRWRNSEGDYSKLRPGFGSQTIGATGVAIQNMFRGDKARAFPNTFKDQYDADPAYSIPETVISPTEGIPRPSQPTGTPPMGGVDVGGRNSQTKNALGIVQTGTKMSGRSFNDMLGEVGGGQFSSNQLPTTGDNPFEGKAPETQAFNTGAESYTGNSLADFGGDGSAAFAQSRERTGNDTFNPSAARVEGGSDRAKAGSLDAALADKDGINSYMSKFSDGDRQRAANRAFLDTEGSMAGLRAKEAANGVVYAGGQHFVAGENADSAAVAIDRSDARNISNNKAKAQDFLAKKTADTVASTSQSPTLLEDGAKNGAFQQDKPMFSGDTPAIGGAVEFDNNNSQTLPTFGAPKGYKPQSAYKDPSFPNPFG